MINPRNPWNIQKGDLLVIKYSKKVCIVVDVYPSLFSNKTDAVNFFNLETKKFENRGSHVCENSVNSNFEKKL